MFINRLTWSLMALLHVVLFLDLFSVFLPLYKLCDFVIKYDLQAKESS